MVDGVLNAEVLLAMARDRSAETRAQLLLTLVDLLRGGVDVLGERERAMMIDILSRLLAEVEAVVRRAVAERLADDPAAPSSLVQFLARDEIQVAWPILRESRVLEDVDLIEIIQFRSLEHKLAIAQRGVISEAVAEALVNSNEESVIVTLLNNPNARLSAAAMEYLTVQSERVDAFQEPLLRRAELTPELAKRMFVWVSAALREHIVRRFELDETTVDDLLEQVVLPGLAQPAQRSADAVLVDEMERAGMISASLMVRTLQEGDVTLFARIVENLTGVPSRLVKRLLFESAGEGLAVLCRFAELPKEEFLEIYVIGRKARAIDAERVRQDCLRLGAFYEGLAIEAVRQTVLRWRRNSNYLAALREIEQFGAVHG